MRDWQLIRQYVDQGSQAAFARLVKRHLKSVYSTCLREVGDPALAEDVTQVVFLLLARKAATLREDAVLSGWLFRTARFASKDTVKQERRRRARERRAVEAMEWSGEVRRDTWEQIDPLLNDALSSLNQRDADAMLLRFYDDLSFTETAAALGVSESAAQMRVTRALDKMRRYLAKRGIGVGAALLATLLAENAARSAPGAPAAAVAHGVLGMVSNIPHAAFPVIAAHQYANAGSASHSGSPPPRIGKGGTSGSAAQQTIHARANANLGSHQPRPPSEINAMATHVALGIRLAKIRLGIAVGALCATAIAAQTFYWTSYAQSSHTHIGLAARGNVHQTAPTAAIAAPHGGNPLHAMAQSHQ